MNGWHRIVVYALMTAVIEGFFIWKLFSYGHEFPPLWIYWIVENVGLLLFPLGQGPPFTGFFALLIGIMCMFFIVSAIGEIVNWLIIEGEDKP